MDLFKMKKFRKAHKPNPESGSEDKSVPQPEDPKNPNGDELGKSVNAPDAEAEAEDDDDDFIMDEVKRRLKELRRNSFLVLIPEESCQEEEEGADEEEEETSFSEWRDVEAEGRQLWSGFNPIYEKYCERMLFFDRLSAQQLNEVGMFLPDSSSFSISYYIFASLTSLKIGAFCLKLSLTWSWCSFRLLSLLCLWTDFKDKKEVADTNMTQLKHEMTLKHD